MSVRKARARLAAAHRHHPADDHTDLERDLQAAHTDDAAQRVVEGLPPLTEAQRSRIRALLAPALDVDVGARGG